MNLQIFPIRLLHTLDENAKMYKTGKKKVSLELIASNNSHQSFLNNLYFLGFFPSGSFPTLYTLVQIWSDSV